MDRPQFWIKQDMTSEMKNIYLSKKWNNLLQHVCRTTHRAHRAVVAILVLCFSFFLLTGCRVSYKLNGASIDYSKTKTIEIAEFPTRSSYVWGPMRPMFNNTLRNTANVTSRYQAKDTRHKQNYQSLST